MLKIFISDKIKQAKSTIFNTINIIVVILIFLHINNTKKVIQRIQIIKNKNGIIIVNGDAVSKKKYAEAIK